MSNGISFCSTALAECMSVADGHVDNARPTVSTNRNSG